MRLYPPSPTAPRSHHECRRPLSLSLAPIAPLSRVCLCASPPSSSHPSLTLQARGNTSVTLSPPSRYPSLSLRPTIPSPSPSVSLPLDRRFFRLRSTPLRVPFLAPAVSLSITFDCAYISLMRLPLFFFLPRSLSLSCSRSLTLARRVRLARAHGPRNSVEHTRRRAFDTLCSVSEGSVRRFHGVAPFSTNSGAASSLSPSRTQARTRSLSLRLTIKRINASDSRRRSLACVSLGVNAGARRHARPCIRSVHARREQRCRVAGSRRVSPRDVSQVATIKVSRPSRML